LYPGTYRDVFGRRLHGGRLALATLRSLRQIARNRSAVQVPYSSVNCLDVQFQLLATAPGTVDRLRHFARAQGATVHDVLLAAFARAMARFLPRRALRAGGAELALGTIVDTRADAAQDLGQTLGAFLAYYLVRCRPDDGGLPELVGQIAGRTQAIKRGRRYFDSLINMQLINHLAPWLPKQAQPNFLRRAQPMTGAISNVVVRDAWPEQCAAGHVFDYLRAAPTGPMVPIVLTPTTFNGRMNIGVTYRLTGFSSAKIAGISESFLDDIERLGQARRSASGPRAPTPQVCEWPAHSLTGCDAVQNVA
jgi:hypothetical protein